MYLAFIKFKEKLGEKEKGFSKILNIMKCYIVK